MKILLGWLSLMTLAAPIASDVTLVSTTKHQQVQMMKDLATGPRATSTLSVTGLTDATIMTRYRKYGKKTTIRNSGFKAIGTIKYADVNPFNPPKNLRDMVVNEHFTSFSFGFHPRVNSSAGNDYLRPFQNINLSISANDIQTVNDTKLWGDSDYLLIADYSERVEDWWSEPKPNDTLPREDGWFWHCYNKTDGKSNDNYLFLVARETPGGITFGFVGQDRLGAGDLRYRNGGLWLSGSTTLSIKQTLNTGFDLNYLQSNMSQTYRFESKTSSNWNSQETKSIIDGREYLSNANLIRNEFDRRLRDGLGSDFQAWSNRVQYDINKLFINSLGKEATYFSSGIPLNSNSSISLSMPIAMTFDKDGITTKIKSVLESPFEFSSDMSADIFNTDVNSTTQTVSNKQLAMNEIQRRIDLLFGIHKNDWEKEIDYTLSIDNKSNGIKISFNDNSGSFINDGQWVSEVIMPYKINLTDEFYNRSIEKRIELSPGLIPDPSSNQSGLVQDSPAYERGSGTDGGTLTYHSAVDLTFTSMKNNSEKLYINGQAQDLIGNVFHASLDSKPFDTDNTGNKPISYEIAVKSNTSTKLTLKIKIASVPSSIGLTWEGWHPDEKGDAESKKQWLLIQPKIFDEHGQQVDNPLYNPLINTKTGLIEQNVFIKTAKPPKYPFPGDPLDKFGKLIKYDKKEINNQATKYVPQQSETSKMLYGYIAQAMVSQMGTSFTNDLNGLAINHVDRVQLNPTDFSEIGIPTRVDLQNEANFSTAGLWHYIIYLNNKVDGKPLDQTNLTDAPEISATQGSTINKLVYITGSDNENRYQSFTDLDFVKKNANVSDFWTTIQARHLKAYLKIKNFTSIDLQTVDYEHLMTYWNNYVQDVVRNLNLPSQNNFLDLTYQLGMTKVLMNETTVDGIKNKIQNKVESYFKQIKSDSVYNTDYIITDSESSTTPLEDLDVTNLEQTEANGYSASGNLVIKSLSDGSKLVGTKTFGILNSNQVKEDKVLDLSLLTFPSEEYNFTNISPTTLTREYIDLYIHNILEQNRPEGDYRAYTYGKDYQVSINDSDVDYKQDYSGDSELAIKDFITTDNAELKIKIKAIDSSVKMIGDNEYTIINSKDAPTPPHIKIDIATIFVNTDLGQFGTNETTNGYITKQQIWDKLLEVNEIDFNNPDNIYLDLVIDNFNFLVLRSGVDDNQVPLYKVSIITRATDTNYTGSVTATYTSLIPPSPDLTKIDINEIFLNKDLGELVDTNDNGYIDRNEIWTKLLSINNAENYPDLKMSDFRIQIFQADTNQYYAMIDTLPASKNYRGMVKVTYTSQFLPNPDEPDAEGDDDGKETFNTINLAWIIPVVLLLLGGTITGIYFWFRHRKTKKKMR